MLKVLIVDDEFIFRTGLINCINLKDLHLTLIGEAANGREALKIIQQKSPDIVLLDMIMPEMSGMELIRKLEELNIKTNIIILSCHEDYNYVRDAFKKGVRDYILKLSATPEEISEVIRDVSQKILAEQEAASVHSAQKLQDNRKIRSDIADALRYIEDHYPDNLSLSDVASHIHMSKNHLSYLFQRETGHSFSDYLTNLRIDKAKELLHADKRYTIAEIAEMTGFSDTGYFCKVFKKYTGMPPNHYRQGGAT